MPGALPLLVAVALVVVVAAWTVGSLNGLTGLRNVVRESWRQVDEELDGRRELVPGLADTVRALAPDVPDPVRAVLTAHVAASPARGRSPGRGEVRGRQCWVAEEALRQALRRMFALADGHPLLAADQDFLLLRQELRESEDRIAAGRRRYNDAVAVLNARVTRYPTRLVARWFGIEPAEPLDAPAVPEAPPPAEPLDAPAVPEATTRPWRAMSVCFVALFMPLLDVSVVNVALPSMGRSTGAGPAQLQWVVSGYVLAFGLVPVLAGRLGDSRGRRPVLLAGVAAFVVTSALVGVAPNPALLLVGRFLQGLAGGVINPQVAGLIQELFSGRDRARVFGALGTVVGVSTATGPVVGGLVLAAGGPELGWRLVFFVNVPIGLVTFVLARRWLPAPPRSAGRPARLDVVGALLLGSAVALVLLAAIQGGDSRNPVWALLAVPAPAVAWLFVRWERRLVARDGQPLVDLRLFRIRSYRLGVLVALTFFCAFPGLPFVLALYFQNGLGYTPLQSGLSVTAFALGSAIAAAVSGRLVHRYGRWLTLTALVVFAVGIALAWLIARHLAVASAGVAGGFGAAAGVNWTAGLGVAVVLAPALFLAGLGSGGVITPNQALSLAEVDVSGGGTAAGMLQTSQRIGAAIGPAVVGAVFFATLGARGLATGRGGATTGRGAGTRDAFATALGNGLLVSLGFVLLALVLAAAEVSRRRDPERSGSRAERSTGRRRGRWRAGGWRPGRRTSADPTTPDQPTPDRTT